MESDFYFKFENKFRGNENSILSGLEIYDSLIHQIICKLKEPTILDIGCGRGEFLKKWQKYTPNVIGIENDSKMAKVCRLKNLNIIEDNALDSLQKLSDNSISIITIFHLIEHLEFEYISDVLSDCLRVLHDDGILIIETPSIDNIIVSIKNFYLDHSHKTHINPDSFTFLMENIGFESVKHYFLRGGPMEDSEYNKLTRVFNGVAQDILFISTKSKSMGNYIFEKNTEWELKLRQGITTMQAAIDFDLTNINNYKSLENKLVTQQEQIINLQEQLFVQKERFIVQQKKFIAQRNLLDGVNQEVLFFKNEFKYLWFFLGLLNKFQKLFIVVVKIIIRFFIKIATKFFNLFLQIPPFKRILLSKSSKKFIYFILDFFPNRLKLIITRNLDKKIDKVLEIDSISSYYNSKLIDHYESSHAAKDIHEKLTRNLEN